MRREFLLPFALPLLACSSGNGDVATLDAQLSELETRHEALAAQTEENRRETSDALKRLEALVDVLQAELSKAAEATNAMQSDVPDEAPAPPSTKEQAPLSDLAAAAIGVAPAPVTVDEEGYRVDRHWLRRSLAELADTARGPTVSSNRNGGLRIKGIKPGTLLAELGFRNNDVVLSINEALVNTPEGLARELANAEAPLIVVIQRRKEELKQTYRFR